MRYMINNLDEAHIEVSHFLGHQNARTESGLCLRAGIEQRFYRSTNLRFSNIKMLGQDRDYA